MKPVRVVLYYIAAMALFGMADFGALGLAAAQAQGSGGPCSATPCHLVNVFDPDLADLKPSKPLADVIKAAVDLVKGGSNNDKDRPCYPLPITITIFTKANSSDPSFQDVLDSARKDAMSDYLKAHGLDPQNVNFVKAPGPEDAADVAFNNVDRDPPVLKTNSQPPKGSKVKTGDQIKIHATASERHADGHKSWPSGVKSLQFIANGTLVDSKDYGMKPPPCEVRLFEPVYTVPKNPPPVVHLRVYTEDATGHGTFEEAGFPTHGDWYGRLDWSVHQMMPTGPQDWVGHADLILDDDGQGGLTGTLAGTETQTLAIATCHGVTTWTLKARLTGTITTSAKKITINVMDRQSTRPEMASCGTARTGGDIFGWRHFNEMFQKLAPSADGNSYQSHGDITVSNGTGDCTLILQRAGQ